MRVVREFWVRQRDWQLRLTRDWSGRWVGGTLLKVGVQFYTAEFKSLYLHSGESCALCSLYLRNTFFKFGWPLSLIIYVISFISGAPWGFLYKFGTSGRLDSRIKGLRQNFSQMSNRTLWWRDDVVLSKRWKFNSCCDTWPQSHECVLLCPQVKAALRTVVPAEQKYIEEEPKVSKQVHLYYV